MVAQKFFPPGSYSPAVVGRYTVKQKDRYRQLIVLIFAKILSKRTKTSMNIHLRKK